MKLIDMLNKIANGEKVNFKYDGQLYSSDEDGYLRVDGSMFTFAICEHLLNEEVEIIEEDNKIEKLDIRNEKNCKNNWKWKVYGEEHGYNISTPQKIIADKINEIIDYINKGE